ncbi:membrane protein containing Cytochrome b/b6 [Candidatus Magnetoovum chiemensis]|nr:membrane protein containing Cytochrome b/b6 [Candidatus Magnetoovum chiemensis]
MNNEEKKFYPEYLVEVLAVVFLVLTATLVLALLLPKELGREINFAAPFAPKPEWYFLWLFELLKYFPGKTAFIAAVVIPIGFAAALVMLPFIDNGKLGRLKAILTVAALYLSFIVFSLISYFNP